MVKDYQELLGCVIEIFESVNTDKIWEQDERSIVAIITTIKSQLGPRGTDRHWGVFFSCVKGCICVFWRALSYIIERSTTLKIVSKGSQLLA